MIYEQMLAEKDRILAEIEKLRQEIKTLPDGKIFCCTSGKYTKWFHSTGKTQTYIPKKNRLFAEKLAIKKLLLLQLDDLQRELTAINFYLRHHNSTSHQTELSLFQSPEYNELLTPHYKPRSQELQEWAQASYDKNNKYPEFLIHHSISGHYLRSKSESMIDSLLFKYKIPFHYEECIQLGEINLYPDFTIRHPKTGDFFYWEHFGLMNDINYAKKASNKLQLYISHGIIPTIQLITTYETKENPLTMTTIDQIIQHYFL